MALKGKWQITKDYPTTLFAKDGGLYRITSDNDNKTEVSIKHRISKYFYTEKTMKEFIDGLTKEVVIASGRTTKDETRFMFMHGVDQEYFVSFYEYEQLNPGCSIDLKAKDISIKKESITDKLSGTYEQ